MEQQQRQRWMYEGDRFVNKTRSELTEANITTIYNYQNLPVLSIEEAVQDLIPLVPDLAEYVVQAKHKCNRNSTMLNWNESAAIYLYTMPKPFFSLLNEVLRSGNRNTLTPWLSFLKLLTYALEKLPSLQTVVWRGVSKDIASSFVENVVDTWWSVTSCSTDLNVVRSYLGESNTLFAIKSLHGKDISSFSSIQTEHEVVFVPGTRFRVGTNASNFDNRLSIVYLEEVSQSEQEVPDAFSNINGQLNNIQRSSLLPNIVDGPQPITNTLAASCNNNEDNLELSKLTSVLHDVSFIRRFYDERKHITLLSRLRRSLKNKHLIWYSFILFSITVIVFTLFFAVSINLVSKHVKKETESPSSVTSSILQESSKSLSDRAQLWEQCDGKEYKIRRICENDAKCVARDISYWQCRPEGNCPQDWTCADVTSFENSSLSLEALKKLLTSRAMERGEPSDWSQSIVDLMKLIGQDYREDHLIRLALKLGFKGDVGDSYAMHIWLHKQLLKILAKNGGNLPAEFKE